jgi:hypothetical protein
MPVKRKAAIFHLTNTTNTMQASARIARYLSWELKLPLYDGLAKNIPINLDAAILVNSPTGFADEDWRWFIAQQCVKARRFVFVQNDYKMGPPSQVQRWVERLKKPVSRIMWTSVPDRMIGHDKRSTYVNWNALTWRPERKTLSWNKRQPGLLYYGALRPHREEAIKHYFAANRDYKVIVSAPTRSHERFHQILGDKITLLPPFRNLRVDLQQFQATVYLEDPWSHVHYCSPANRFYECLSAGMAIFFDIETVYCMAQAQFRTTPWMVQNAKDVKARLQSTQIIAHKQRTMWHNNQNYHAVLRQQVQDAWKNLWR